MEQDKKQKKKQKSENGARRQVLEDLFYDFNKSRAQVYWTNFVRGVYFGFGSILGATVVIAIVIWVLGLLVDIPYIGNYIHNTIVIIQKGK